MFRPTVEFLRAVVDPTVCAVKVEQIKVSATPSILYRLTLRRERTGAEGAPVLSLIAKRIAPDWPGDPHGGDREMRFYQEIAPRLPMRQPRVYYAGIDKSSDEGGDHRLILLENLTTYHFPPPTHRWTWPEMQTLLATYARLHSSGAAALPPASQRSWMWTIQRRPWQRNQVLGMADELAACGAWAHVVGLERPVDWTLGLEAEMDARPVTLIHNDVYPPNVGFPINFSPAAPAVLIDWEMAGWGLAELDLAYLFMQPFSSSAHLERAACLDFYWAERARLGDVIPAPDERRTTQRYADALWAIFEITVAHFVVTARPFAPGSPPQVFWQAMLPVLHGKIEELLNTVMRK